MAVVLATRWWTLTIRGVAAILFGILTFLFPGSSLFALVILFGAYALVDGIFNLVLAMRQFQGRSRWGWLIFEGIVSILAGLAAFAWPAITAIALLSLIAAWAIITGVAEIIAAIRLRKQIKGEWMLALAGILSITFGVLMLLFPAAGALAVVYWIGAYAIVFGGLLVGLSLRLRAWGREPSHRIPSEGAPAAA
jgi:uncharacterized membrane protein HdeD (DUF308 family)